MTELLTGYHDNGVHNPFSAITIASMADIGYEVSYEEAEEYVLPTPRRGRPSGKRREGSVSVMTFARVRLRWSRPTESLYATSIPAEGPEGKAASEYQPQ